MVDAALSDREKCLGVYHEQTCTNKMLQLAEACRIRCDFYGEGTISAGTSPGETPPFYLYCTCD